MEIYIVQKGDTVDSIAQRFGISVQKLIIDNGIASPPSLAEGQTLVIAHPTQIYTVKDGDTLDGIAEAFGISLMQLLRNNPVLSSRDYIYPGETLTISYDNSKGRLTINGIAYPFIRRDTLIKTLPYLTYLTIFNYQADKQGNITENVDDTNIILTAKDYGVAPVMLITTLSSLGVPNTEASYSILLDKSIQDNYVKNLLNILKTKGYYGVNITLQYITPVNLTYYNNFLSNVTSSLTTEGYSVFVTINPRFHFENSNVTFEEVDYSSISQYAESLTFLSYDWGYSDAPPSQVSVITSKSFLDYIVSILPPDKIAVGMPTLGYDWQLPYVEGITRANSLNFDSAVNLAYEENAVIQFNEATLSAYFEYTANNLGSQSQHIVWFKDARSINSSLEVLMSYHINGTAIWNIMYFFAQLWLVINTQYEIEKVLT